MKLPNYPRYEANPYGNPGITESHSLAYFRKTELIRFGDLTQTGLKVFAYLIDIYDPSKDSVLIDFTECMKYTGYTSKSSIWRGISSLLEFNFIKRSSNTNEFFINPEIVTV